MKNLTPIEQLLVIGKLPRITTAALNYKLDNAQISWETAVICCQVFKDHATAPVIATCLFHSIADNDQAMQNLLGYNPQKALNELENSIVRYCVILAELHELNHAVVSGNKLVLHELQRCQEDLDKVNKLISDLSKKAEKKAKQPTKNDKKYPH